MLRIGETIDRYRIEALIGQGGMAAVYRARHVQLGSEHAIKVLFVTAPQVRERMFREGQVQARLRHPNIVQVTDVLLVQNAPALVMEYVDGPALDTWLLENRPTIEESLWLFRGILRGVSAAHEGGVVHRDLKPANVLLAPTHEGLVPKVADFGLVKPVSEVAVKGIARATTQSGMALGTPEYMSPEQIRDASEVDQRTDMWALGCLLYELVCHRRAFSGPDKMSTFTQIVAGAYEPPRKFVDDLPRNVSEAISALLEVERDKRMASCAKLVDLLYGGQPEEPKIGRLAVGPRPTGPLLAGSPHSEITIPPEDGFASTSGVAVLSADVPTGIPAARRAAVPTGLRDERPLGALATQDSTPRTLRPSSVIIPGLLLVIGLLGVALVALYTLPPAERVEQGLAPMLPDPIHEDVAPPAPPPAPSAAPTPDPPPPAPSATPAPASPRPAPSRPAASPAPAPAPAPPAPQPTASVSVQGDAKAVWLVSDAGRFSAGDPVRAGRYKILADFGGAEPVGAGQVDLRAGDRVTLNCSTFLLQCRVQ